VKKSLRKLNLCRETLHTLENLALEQIGGAKPQTSLCSPNSTPILACDYTLSCPGWCPEA
jgi:hypothetical protein